ncbi:MAG: beta-N-acetylhexosaminidase [Lachnospiraceae bacterium]|nr:beta-N-acetylhexosaminidase [Lachnospiraceae bacterium]
MLILTGAAEEERILFHHIRGYLKEAPSDMPVDVVLTKTEQNLTITKKGSHAQINYGDLRMLARGFCLLNERLDRDFELKESLRFTELTLMLDCSRNAVPALATLKALAVRLAMMGYSSIQLYTEDTFEIEGYPYFGYMRGRYSKKELKEFDQFCMELGMELVPCIQTLAHLGSALRWSAFHEFTDIGDILLAGDEKTYDFVEAMIRSCAETFHSRTIHIGMDEAHLVGLGKYLKQNGYEERNSILCRYLSRVLEICKKYDYHPMMWSDMFFRLASRDGEYYDENAHIPDSVIDMVPEEVSLVYWDYYTEKKESYDRMIAEHQRFANEIVFAGGAWKWRGFAPGNTFSLSASKAALASCAEHHVRRVMVTAWGDNGGEASHFSVFPVLQCYAEVCFGHEPEEAWLEQRMKACTGENYRDFLAADLPNLLPGIRNDGWNNPSKYLLYQDVMCPLFDRHTKEAYVEAYRKAAERLREAAEGSKNFGYLFDTLAALCSVLEKKSRLGVHIQEAYLEQDKKRLEELAKETIPETLHLAEVFHETAAKQWQRENKIFGWEVIDIRLGAVEARLRSAASRIQAYCAGELNRLEELEEPRLFYDGRTDEDREDLSVAPECWHDIVTGCKMLL